MYVASVLPVLLGSVSLLVYVQVVYATTRPCMYGVTLHRVVSLLWDQWVTLRRVNAALLRTSSNYAQYTPLLRTSSNYAQCTPEVSDAQ